MTGAALPFSAATRAEHWRSLSAARPDLLVVGGGITGVAVARDAACRGLDVVLVEAGDFAEGTSSRSSRLVHGGLRYLETLDFVLVFEALAERRRLLELAPHLVRPLPFLFPVYSGDEVGLLRLRAGMWLYDLLALFRNIQLHRILGRGGVLRREPLLRKEGLRGGAVYYDAQVDDARLTLAVARAAHDSGARLVPHARVVDFVRDGRGNVEGARLRDAASGDETEVRARLVLSATGPWTDAVRRLADPAAPPRLRPTKGVHILLPRERVRNAGAIIFRSAVDGRVMFVLPWRDFTYVGTTDTDYAGDPADASATPEDVEYLLASANALFPAAGLEGRDVISTWTGVRPLLAPRAARASAGQTSREHEIWRDPSGLLCVAGGKLTTFRSMAAQTVEAAAEILHREHRIQTGDCLTEHLPLPGAPQRAWNEFRTRLHTDGANLRLSPAQVDHLARAHGTEALTLLDEIRAHPELARPLVPDLPYLWAEVLHAVQHEMATTLEDVLRRRLHLFAESPDGGLQVAPEVARRMAREPGIAWDADETRRQLESYRRAVEDTR